MPCEVLLFGPQATLAGKRSVLLELPAEKLTALELLHLLTDAEPKLAESIPTSRLAVNHEFVA